MPDQNELDRVLDAALSSYSAAGPEFEERLLRSLASAEDARMRQRRRWLSWAIAIPGLACLLIAVMLVLHPRRRQIDTPQQAQGAPAVPRGTGQEIAAVSPKAAATRTHRTRSTLRDVPAEVAKLPKREMFPTPQPLTPAEQAFVRYVGSAPEKDRRALLQAQAQQDAPLEISAIKISPITIPDSSGNQGEP